MQLASKQRLSGSPVPSVPTPAAPQSPQPHDPRHSGLSNDKRATTAAAGVLLPGWTCRRVQRVVTLVRRLKSVARRPPSSPATREHWVHSAQAIWAGIARWHTCCSHALGRVAARPAEWLLVTHLLLGHVQVFGSEVDGWMTLRELHPTMHLRHAADGRPRREVGKTAGLKTSQIPPRGASPLVVTNARRPTPEGY